VKNWFSIHDENKKGWYTGEGTLVLMTDGREYDDGVIASQPWQDLMGITRSVNIKPHREEFGQSYFVGGVAYDDLACAGMDYLLAQEGTKQVRAKKSFFFTKDHIILLGSDISSKGEGVVAKTILFGIPIFEDSTVKVDGKTITEDTKLLLRKGEHKLFIRNIALWIPDGQNVRLELRTLSGDYQGINSMYYTPEKYMRRYVHLIRTHQDKTPDYAAVLAPAVKNSSLVDQKTRPKIILCNSEAHAIQSADNRIVQMVAYAPLKIDGLVSVNKPAFLQWQIDKSGSTLTLSLTTNIAMKADNPQYGQKNTLQVVINQPLSLCDEYTGISLKKTDGKSVVDITVRDGWTRTIKFKID
jgi:hypothetical protein